MRNRHTHNRTFEKNIKRVREGVNEKEKENELTRQGNDSILTLIVIIAGRAMLHCIAMHCKHHGIIIINSIFSRSLTTIASKHMSE